MWTAVRRALGLADLAPTRAERRLVEALQLQVDEQGNSPLKVINATSNAAFFWTLIPCAPASAAKVSVEFMLSSVDSERKLDIRKE
jgi:hypothetical protein